MGIDQSTPKGPLNSSYFGTSSNDITEDNAMATIREMQIQRYEKRRGPVEPEKPHLKLMLSVTEFTIKNIDGILILSFMVKTETSGRFVLISNGRMNSCTFYKTEDKVNYCIPIPDKSDFSLEISCSIDDYDGDIVRGVVLITKESFKFRLIEAGSVYTCQLLSQTIITKNKNCIIEKNLQIPVEVEPRNDRCLFCLENEAQKSLCDNPEHKIICDLCEAAKQIKILTCPLCSQTTQPQPSQQNPQQTQPTQQLAPPPVQTDDLLQF